ncbi:MAG TPA: 5-bromo-4-chloroindolyl phosphate hydrolysis family protein [Alphaproteobacteria bacterium]
MTWPTAQPRPALKSLGLAYVLWFVGGALGAHRFYLGSPRVGITMIVGWLIVASMPGDSGAVLALLLIGWTLLDALLIPGLARGASFWSGQPFPITAPLAWFVIGLAVHLGTSMLHDLGGDADAPGLPQFAGIAWSLFMAGLPATPRRRGILSGLAWMMAAIPLQMISAVTDGAAVGWIIAVALPTLCLIAAGAQSARPPSGEVAPAAQEPPAPPKAAAAAAQAHGRDLLAETASYARSLPKHAAKIKAIVETGEKIFDEIERDPKSRAAVQRFLDYYMDSAAKIIALHAKVAVSKGGRTEEGLAEALDDIHRTFQHFLERALEDDVADLDAELTVLRTKMRSEGIS